MPHRVDRYFTRLNPMNIKRILQLEEVLLFGLTIWAYQYLPYAWYWFPLFLLVPDVSAIGYFGGKDVGRSLYNLFHNRALVVAIGLVGWYLGSTLMQFWSVVFFAHIALDRALGMGLKLKAGFHYTHMGPIGKKRND